MKCSESPEFQKFVESVVKACVKLRQNGSTVDTLILHPKKAAALGNPTEVYGLKIETPSMAELDAFAEMFSLQASSWGFWNPESAYLVNSKRFESPLEFKDSPATS